MVKDVATDELIPLQFFSSNIKKDMTDDIIVDCLYRMIMQLEMHEAAEHFFYKGIKVNDPHRNDSKSVIHVPEVFDVSMKAIVTLTPEGFNDPSAIGSLTIFQLFHYFLQMEYELGLPALHLYSHENDSLP